MCSAYVVSSYFWNKVNTFRYGLDYEWVTFFQLRKSSAGSPDSSIFPLLPIRSPSLCNIHTAATMITEVEDLVSWILCYLASVSAYENTGCLWKHKRSVNITFREVVLPPGAPTRACLLRPSLVTPFIGWVGGFFFLWYFSACLPKINLTVV